MVLGCVGGWGYVSYLDGHIKHGALSFGDQGVAQPDGDGGTPLSILLIGSDTRDTAADLALGGSRDSVGGPAHADMEMLLHVSADRRNASLISIPRDTMVPIPACTDPATGRVHPESPHEQITDSLSHGGPGCTVYTWHRLTGIHIDHYMMVDSGGVVSMADAIGGVPVCTTGNVADPYSQPTADQGHNAPLRQLTTSLAYPPADAAPAAAVAAALHLPPGSLRQVAGPDRPTLVIGADWPGGDAFPTVATPSAGAVPTTAPLQSGDRTECAKVNPVYSW